MTQSPKFRGAAVDAVVDVRSKLEFWMGHLPGAVCVPVERLPDGLAAISGLSPSSRILVYCASGARSSAAAAELKAAGFRNVIDGGGMAAASEHYTP
jgi:phage shock protein E